VTSTDARRTYLQVSDEGTALVIVRYVVNMLEFVKDPVRLRRQVTR